MLGHTLPDPRSSDYDEKFPFDFDDGFFYYEKAIYLLGKSGDKRAVKILEEIAERQIQESLMLNYVFPADDKTSTD